MKDIIMVETLNPSIAYLSRILHARPGPSSGMPGLPVGLGNVVWETGALPQCYVGGNWGVLG